MWPNAVNARHLTLGGVSTQFYGRFHFQRKVLNLATVLLTRSDSRQPCGAKARTSQACRAAISHDAPKDSLLISSLPEHNLSGPVQDVQTGQPGRNTHARPCQLSSPESEVFGNPQDTPVQGRGRHGARGRPWTPLHARLDRALRSGGLLKTDSVLIAVSGGQDSVCLLQLLVDLQPRWGWRLGVVHCDHRWRPDSAANAEFVRQLAEERLGLTCHVRVAPPGLAHTERAARAWRYGVLGEVAVAEGYSAVVTAHTATDRAETMLLNLLRGAGPDGLVALARSRVLVAAQQVAEEEEEEDACGDGPDGAASNATANRAVLQGTNSYTSSCGDDSIARSGSSTSGSGGASQAETRSNGLRRPTVHLVRPLLKLTRDDTQVFVRQRGLPYYHDVTNDCNDLRRNLLRNQVLPTLRRDFNPQLDRALFRFLEVLQAEMEFLDEAARALYDTVALPPQPGGLHAAAAAAAASRSGKSTGEKGVHAATANGGCDGVCMEHRPEGSAGGGGGGVSARGREVGAERGSGVDEEGMGAEAGGLKVESLNLAALRGLPLAMQRRVVHRWLRKALRAGTGAIVGAREGTGGDRDGTSTGKEGAGEAIGAANRGEEGADGLGKECFVAAGEALGRGRRGSEVGYEDVSRCLALLHAPNRSNSDSLCSGLMATVRDGALVLRRARQQGAEAGAVRRRETRRGTRLAERGAEVPRLAGLQQALEAEGLQEARPGGTAAVKAGARVQRRATAAQRQEEDDEEEEPQGAGEGPAARQRLAGGSPSRLLSSRFESGAAPPCDSPVGAAAAVGEAARTSHSPAELVGASATDSVRGRRRGAGSSSGGSPGGAVATEPAEGEGLEGILFGRMEGGDMCAGFDASLYLAAFCEDQLAVPEDGVLPSRLGALAAAEVRVLDAGLAALVRGRTAGAAGAGAAAAAMMEDWSMAGLGPLGQGQVTDGRAAAHAADDAWRGRGGSATVGSISGSGSDSVESGLDEVDSHEHSGALGVALLGRRPAPVGRRSGGGGAGREEPGGGSPLRGVPRWRARRLVLKKWAR